MAFCYPSAIVLRLYVIISLLICGLVAGVARADTYKLTTGESLEGEALLTSANDQGVQIKIAEGEYKRAPWTSFSQEDLKTFAKNPKVQPLVEPFIEVTQAEKIKKTEVNIKQPPRLELPPRQSLVGALFSSGLGVLLMLLLYAATIYAAYEVSIFRVQPPLLVCGLAAIPGLGVLSPLVFALLPNKVQPTEPPPDVPPEQVVQAAPAGGAEEGVNPMLGAGVEHPAGLKLAHSTETEQQAKPALPKPTTYQRGQFTFNRRFFETKFAGFFSVVRRDADKDMVLVIKSSRGEYAGQRISRIAANDLHLQVQRGHATEEVLIPFQEIQEVTLKHKDA
ncbi:MAG TPA: hypothetical protein VN578_18730 [Candidatus Binatia bacterium]|jgi:hypothetical protein|nr:hypothetical protein [Candidatus Binatia bacterium]